MTYGHDFIIYFVLFYFFEELHVQNVRHDKIEMDSVDLNRIFVTVNRISLMKRNYYKVQSEQSFFLLQIHFKVCTFMG